MSLLATIGAIGSIGSAIGSIGSAIANYKSQQDNLSYQKKLQQQVFEREDNAYTRAVEDMRRAGLSPNQGVSPSQAGSVVSTNAPQMNLPEINFLQAMQQKQAIANMKIQNKQAIQDFNQSKELFEIKKIGQSLQNTLLLSEIDKTDAQTEFIMNNSTNKNLLNEYQIYKNKNLDRDFWLDLIFKSVGAFSRFM